MSRLIAGIGSVTFGTTDLNRAVDFYERVWSLRTVARTAQSAFLCGQSSLHHILALEKADAPTVRRFTFEATSMNALDELHRRIAARGLPVSATPHAFVAHGGGVGFDTRDPEGRNISFAFGCRDGATSPAPLPDRITKVTHLNLNSGAYETMRMYMVDTLGFTVADETKINGFFNCGVDHHSIVIGRRQQPTLNHVAFEMPDLDSVMRMAGTMTEAGYPVEWGVGRHGPGNNVFAYFAGPEEMPIECTAEVLQVDQTYRYRGPDEWSFPPGRTDQWGVTGQQSTRIKRIQNLFSFPELPLR